MTALLLNPFPMFYDQLGQPLDEGYIYVGEANKDPRQFPINVYLDAAKTNLAVQPLRTINGVLSNGYKPIPIFADEPDYSLLVLNKEGKQVFYDKSSVTSNFGVTDALDYIQQVTNNAELTAQQKINDLDQVIDDANALTAQQTAALNQAVEAVGQAAAGNLNGSDLLVLATNNKTQKFINEQWLDFAPYYIQSDISTTTNNLKLLITQAKAQGKGIRCAPIGTVQLNDDVDFSGIRFIDFRADIQTSKTVIIGGFSFSGDYVDISFANITNGTSALTGAIPAIDTLVIRGVKNGTVRVGNVNLLRLHANSGDTTQSSNAYFKLFPSLIRALRISDEGTGAWNNEFVVEGGRLIDVDITGTGYTPNHILFWRNVFEGANAKIRFKKTWNNRIEGARFEGTSAAPGVIFENDAHMNTVISSWSGQGNPRGQFVKPAIPVTDAGQGNMVTTQAAIESNKTEIISISAQSMIVANATDATALNAEAGAVNAFFPNKHLFVPSLKGFTAKANRWIALTGLIPVKLGDAITYDMDYDHSNMRPMIYVYDANQKQITDEAGGGVYVQQPSLAMVTSGAALGIYTISSGVSAAGFNSIGTAVVRPEVAFIRVGFYVTADSFFRSVNCQIWTQTIGRTASESQAQRKQTSRALAGTPTMGYLPLGYRIYDSLNKCENYVSFQYETTLNGALASGATSATVTTPSTIANGDIYGILLDDGTTAWGVVSGLSGSAFTVTALASTAADGARVVFNRWATRNGSYTYASGSLAANTVTTVTTLTIIGAKIGDKVEAFFNKALSGSRIFAEVTASDTVVIYHHNPTGGSVSWTGGSIRVNVFGS